MTFRIRNEAGDAETLSTKEMSDLVAGLLYLARRRHESLAALDDFDVDDPAVAAVRQQMAEETDGARDLAARLKGLAEPPV